MQAVILNPFTGKLSVYDPEVITAGQAPPVVPPVPHLQAGDVVAIWTGFNGNQLKLTGDGASQFVNFAQQSYDNSPQFFAALRFDVRAGLVKVPPVGTASDGMACPTTRDFSLVDQDQSDNVPVTYTYDGGASNGSDEQLLNLVQQSLGCAEWKVPLLDPAVAVGDGAGMSTAGLLQEEQASVAQQAPVALVPGNDEFVTDNGQFAGGGGAGQPDIFFQNLYRLQVGQPLTLNDRDTLAYCQNLAAAGAVRLGQDAATEAKSPAPVFAQIGTNLANVLAGRFQATWVLLNCPALTGMPSPVTPVTDPNTGLVTGATYPAAGTTPAPTVTPTAPAPTPTSTATTPAPAPTTSSPSTSPGGYSLVQASTTISDPTTGEGPLNSDGAAAVQAVLGQPVASGDLVVMWATDNNSNNGPFPLVLSGATAGWHLAAETGGPFNWAGLWYQVNPVPGEQMPTITDLADAGQANPGAAADYIDVQAAEFHGAGALDQSGSGTAADGTAVKAAGADGTADLVVGVGTWNGSNTGDAPSVTLTGGSGVLAAAGDGSADVAGGPPFYAFAWATGNAGASDTVTGSNSMFENDGDLLVASFRPAT